MKSSKKLQPIANLAKQNERGAARNHGNVLRALKQQENQLNELISYRNEYINTFNSAGANGMSVIQFQDYTLFLHRLDDAIKQQQQLVTNGRTDCDQSKSKWLDKRNRSKMVNKVVEKRQLNESKQQDKREQRELESQPGVSVRK
ncbi:MAG: flagellar export protein FliJ [Thiotrichaceae bacterium]|nr:MAG: flagellar export protein FliJ [Thiotrichaceae bacterium]